MYPTIIQLHLPARICDVSDSKPSVRGAIAAIGEGSTIDRFANNKYEENAVSVRNIRGRAFNCGWVWCCDVAIYIGDHVGIAANCVAVAVNHEFRKRIRLIPEQGFMPPRSGIAIEDDARIGPRCVILDGAVVQQGCVLGATSRIQGVVEADNNNARNPSHRKGSRQ